MFSILYTKIATIRNITRFTFWFSMHPNEQWNFFGGWRGLWGVDSYPNLISLTTFFFWNICDKINEQSRRKISNLLYHQVWSEYKSIIYLFGRDYSLQKLCSRELKYYVSMFWGGVVGYRLNHWQCWCLRWEMVGLSAIILELVRGEVMRFRAES